MLGERKVVRRFLGEREITNSILNEQSYMSSSAKKAGCVFQIDAQKTFEVGSNLIANRAPSIPEIELDNIAYTWGDFQMDTNGDGLADGLIAGSIGGFSLIGGVQRFTPTAEFGQLYVDPDLTNEITGMGVTWYISVLMKGNSPHDRLRIVYDNGAKHIDVLHSGSGEFELLSAFGTNSVEGSKPFIFMGSSEGTSGWTPIDIKKFFILRTDIFSKTHWGVSISTNNHQCILA